MARHPQLDLDVQLCFPLYATSRAFTRAYAPLLEPFGLTYPQYLSLMALWSGDHRPGDEMTVGDLGRTLHLDSGTLTPVLKRLEQLGYVTRRRDPGDERRVLVGLTDRGEALQDELADVPRAAGEALGLTADDWRSLRATLDPILERLAGR